jgi:hypothetical protein
MLMIKVARWPPQLLSAIAAGPNRTCARLWGASGWVLEDQLLMRVGLPFSPAL